MIVGVNMEDTGNSAPVMAFMAKQFVVLDGVKMKAEFEADTEAEYFNAITGFDSKHGQFCIDFLQALNIKHPLPELPELYKTFCGFKNIDALSSHELSATVRSLCRYNLTDTTEAHTIYSTLKGNFAKITEHDFDAAVVLAEWVERNSRAMNDNDARENLSSAICGLMKGNMFSGRHELLEHILSSSFGKDAAAVAGSQDALQDFISSAISPQEGLYFCNLFAICARMIERKITLEESRALVSRCISLCTADWDRETMAGLMDFLSSKDTRNRSRARDIVMTCAGENAEFVVHCILDGEPEICASFSEAVKFCALLDAKGLSKFAVEVLIRGIKSARKTDELIRFADKIGTVDYLSDDAKGELFAVLDSRVKPDSPYELAKAVQKYRPEFVVCPVSANVVGLSRMSSREKRTEPISKMLGKYAVQGFPCLTDGKFIDRFCYAFMSMNLASEEDYSYMYGLLFRKNTPRDILLSVVYELVSNVKKRPEDWLRFLVYTSGAHRNEAINAVLDVLYEMPKLEKVLSQLDKATPRKDKVISDMFENIEELAEKYRESRTKKGWLEKLAELLFGDEDGE
jgi:hypothetical protein